MAAVSGTSWKRGDGVITAQSAASGIGTSIRYGGLVAWVLGGEGAYAFTDKLPKREWPNDTFIQIAAPVGTPCTVTVSPAGEVLLFVAEVFGTEDC